MAVSSQNRMVTRGLGPARQLEVVVERRHSEHAAAGRAERQDLDDDRAHRGHEQRSEDTSVQVGPSR